MKKRFPFRCQFARVRYFPGANVGSDHGMMMTLQTRLKKLRIPTQPRINFDLEKLNDPQAAIGGRFAPLTMLVDEDAELDSIVTEFNKLVSLLVTDTATGRPWVTDEILVVPKARLKEKER